MRRRRVTLGVEQLENRIVPAGNVRVTVDDGDMKIEGNNADNSITITQTPTGDYVITGNPAGTPPTPTTVNGRAAVTILGSRVRDDFRINMKGGNDTVVILGTTTAHLTVPDDLEIKMGSGNDIVTIFRSAIDNLAIGTGHGDDELDVETSTIGGDLDIDTGVGRDIARVLRSNIDDDVGIDTGDGNDPVLVIGSTIGGDLDIDTGDGADTVSGSIGSIGGDLDIDTGDGDDFMIMILFNIGDNLAIDTGDGADTVKIGTFTVADETFIRMGDNDDKLEVSSSTFTGLFRADGEDEDVADDFTDFGGNNFNGGTDLDDFET